MSAEAGPSSSSGEVPDDMVEDFERHLQGGTSPHEALADLLNEHHADGVHLAARLGDTIDGYRLEHILGVGGMGVTYRCINAEGDVTAIKLVSHLTHTARARFENECKVLQALRHKAIVQYRAHGILDDGCAWLRMDYIQGSDLELLLGASIAEIPSANIQDTILLGIDVRGPDVLQHPSYRRRILRLLATIADALSHAHDHGIVHRDVKPANILVKPDLSPILIDFGLSRDHFRHVSMTRSGVAIGTFAYMSPEQLGHEDEGVDHRSDIYALGLVLYRAIVGRDLREDVRESIHEMRRPFLLSSRDSASVALDLQAILYSCLDPRPKRRYESASQLAIDLRAAAEGNRVSTRRPNLLNRHLRSRASTITWTILFALSIFTLSWSLWTESHPLQVVTFEPDATIRIDGGDPTRSPLLVDLKSGLHQIEVTLPSGEIHHHQVRIPEEDFVADQHVGPRMLYGYDDGMNKVRDDPRATTPLYLTTGDTLDRNAKSQARTIRDAGGEVSMHWTEPDQAAPEIYTTVVPGKVTIEASNAAGQVERQELSIDSSDRLLDVHLLPGLMRDVDGEFRRTLSTPHSPIPSDMKLELEGATLHLAHSLRRGDYGGLIPAAPSCITPRTNGGTARLSVLFPKPMRTAVIMLRYAAKQNAELSISYGDQSHDLTKTWRERGYFDGQPHKIQIIEPDNPFISLTIRATMRATQRLDAVTPQVRFLESELGAGHVSTNPPCFAIVASASKAAQVDTNQEHGTRVLTATEQTPQVDVMQARPQLAIPIPPCKAFFLGEIQEGPLAGLSLVLAVGTEHSNNNQFSALELATNKVHWTRTFQEAQHYRNLTPISVQHQGGPRILVGSQNYSIDRFGQGSIMVLDGATGKQIGKPITLPQGSRHNPNDEFGQTLSNLSTTLGSPRFLTHAPGRRTDESTYLIGETQLFDELRAAPLKVIRAERDYHVFWISTTIDDLDGDGFREFVSVESPISHDKNNLAESGHSHVKIHSGNDGHVLLSYTHPERLSSGNHVRAIRMQPDLLRIICVATSEDKSTSALAVDISIQPTGPSFPQTLTHGRKASQIAPSKLNLLSSATIHDQDGDGVDDLLLNLANATHTQGQIVCISSATLAPLFKIQPPDSGTAFEIGLAVTHAGSTTSIFALWSGSKSIGRGILRYDLEK